MLYYDLVKLLMFLSAGDTEYKRRELRNNWKERRSTGVIGVGTLQDAFVIENEPEGDIGGLKLYSSNRRTFWRAI